MHIRHQRLLAALGYLCRKPIKALKAIHRDRFEPRYWENYVQKKYNCPQGLPQVNILDLFPNFSETVYPFACLEASATPVDVALLKALAQNFTQCAYLEIGRWRGESLANVASVAASCLSLSLPKEQMRRIGFSESMIAQDAFFIADQPNIKCIDCDTMTFDFASLQQKFDLIFVDGDHHHAGVKSDTENVFTLMRDEHSIIVWHDYAQSPERVRWNVFAGIFDGLPPEEHKNVYHVSNTLCAIYCKTPLPAVHKSFAITPENTFSITITGAKL